MKAFFITGSIIFFVLTLIVAFENMGISCSGFLFVFIPLASPFLIVLSVAMIGFLFGVFFTGLLVNLLRNKPEDEEDAGGDW
jgi:hypothetical protein